MSASCSSIPPPRSYLRPHGNREGLAQPRHARQVAMRDFGASGKGADVYEKFATDAVAQAARAVVRSVHR